MHTSLIGYLGQALFPCLFWVFVTHPGHASLRKTFHLPTGIKLYLVTVYLPNNKTNTRQPEQHHLNGPD